MAEYKTKEQKRAFYDSVLWKRLRKEVKKRDQNECQICKREGRVVIDDPNARSRKVDRKKIQLIVHHIKEIEEHPDLAADIDNLETVCVNCHNKLHGRYFKYFFKKKQNKWAQDEKW